MFEGRLSKVKELNISDKIYSFCLKNLYFTLKWVNEKNHNHETLFLLGYISVRLYLSHGI